MACDRMVMRKYRAFAVAKCHFEGSEFKNAFLGIFLCLDVKPQPCIRQLANLERVNF
jgi:hypothetical protein